MRLIAFALSSLLVIGLVGCAHDEERRAAQDAGGTLPWNRPQSWEGPGMLGTQMGGTP